MTPSRSERWRRAVRLTVTGAVAITVLFAAAFPAIGARTQSNLVLIRADDTIEEDLYAAGNTIQVDGRINGDLVASALDTIRITGVVDGTVTAIASRIEVSGEVTGSLRVATPDLAVSGTIGGDVLTAAWSAETTETSRVQRDLLVWARSASLRGEVGRNIEGQQGRLEVGGSTGGNVEVTVSSLEVLPATLVEGDLVYTSESVAAIDGSAVIEGSVIDKRALPVNVRIRAIRLLVGVLSVIATLALGLAVVWIAPDRVQAASALLRRRPLAALGWGLGVLAVPLVAAVIAGMIVVLSPRETGVPLVLVFLPIVAGLASIVGMVALTAPVPVATALGSAVKSERSVHATFLLGFAVLFVAWLLPWIGGLVGVATIVAGLGAWVLAPDEGERSTADGEGETRMGGPGSAESLESP